MALKRHQPAKFRNGQDRYDNLRNLNGKEFRGERRWGQAHFVIGVRGGMEEVSWSPKLNAQGCLTVREGAREGEVLTKLN